MTKSKLMLPILAVIVGVAASAFTAPQQSGKPFDTGEYWYKYTGSQDPTSRTQASNYSDPQLVSFPCDDITNECAVQVTVTLDAQGNPPDHPDFTGASFTGTDGYPIKNSGLIKNNKLESQ